MIEDKIVEGSITIGKLGIYLKAKTAGGRELDFNLVEQPELRTVGISNITADNYFALFMDFDRITKSQLLMQLAYLYREYGCSHFLVLSTGEKRFHAICFEKFKLEEIVRILNDSLCDYAFKNIPVKSDKGWILRIKPKVDKDGNVVRDRPVFNDFVIYAEPGRKLSRAHLEFFAFLYPGLKDMFRNSPALNEKYWDGNTVISVINYGTSNKNIFANFSFEFLENSRNMTINWINDTEKNIDSSI